MQKLLHRTRAGNIRTFEQRYMPVPVDEHTILRRWDDPEILKADEKLVWTIVEGDNGKLYLVPGFATVNYIGRVLCSVPYPPEEETLPGYVY